MLDPDHRPILEYGSPEEDDRVSWLGGICFRLGVGALLCIPLGHYFLEARLIGWEMQERVTYVAAGTGLLAYLLGMASIFVDRQIRWIAVVGMVAGPITAVIPFFGRAKH